MSNDRILVVEVPSGGFIITDRPRTVDGRIVVPRPAVGHELEKIIGDRLGKFHSLCGEAQELRRQAYRAQTPEAARELERQALAIEDEAWRSERAAQVAEDQLLQGKRMARQLTEKSQAKAPAYEEWARNEDRDMTAEEATARRLRNQAIEQERARHQSRDLRR